MFGKLRIAMFFQWFESKSRLVKAAGAEAAVSLRHENLHAAVARSTFVSQNVQNTPCWDNFEQFRCRKFARRCGANTFATQNVKSMKASDHFLKFRCRKFARCCGQKHICKSKCTKHTMFGPVLEVQMSKICTPLWPEAHL